MLNKFILVISLLGSLAATANGVPVSGTPADLAGDDLVSAVTNSPVKNPQQPSANINPLVLSDASEQDDKSPSLATAFNLFNLPFEELMKLRATSVSFFEHDLLMAGSSVSVIERGNWQRIGARRTLESIAGEPSVMLLPTLGGRHVVAIRGYGQLASSRGVATLVDGIPMNEPHLGSGQTTAQNINLGVLDRIEVIRGPGSALYGSDAFHGVISMSTFESEEDLTRISLEGGSEHYYQNSLQHSVGLGEHGRLDLALGVSGEERDRSYQAQDLQTMAAREFNPQESYRSQSGSLKLTLNPSPQLKIKGGLLVDNYEAYNYPGAFYTVGDSDSNSKTLAGQLSATHSFAAGQTLEARIHHMRNDSPRRWDQLLFGGPIEVDALVKQQRTGAKLIFRQPAEEKRGTEYAVSLGFERVDVNQGYLDITRLDPPSAPSLIDATGNGQYRDISHLLLDARTVLWDDQWSLLYGGRLDHYSDLGGNASPRLGLLFKPVEDTAIKLLYQRAFRAPSIGESYSTVPPVVNFNLDPEILHSFELIFLKQRASWNAELLLFYNQWQDGILRKADASFPGGFRRANFGENQAQGIEASFSWVSDIWRANIGGSYVTSRNLTVDEDFELFPTVLLSAGVGRTVESFGLQIYLNNQYFYGAQDIEYNATLLGSPEDLPAYWRTDLNVTKRFSSGMDLYVNIVNLFDRDNRVPAVAGFPGGVQDRSLSISAGIQYAF
jgi:outer membrane cobalamin receptor